MSNPMRAASEVRRRIMVRVRIQVRVVRTHDRGTHLLSDFGVQNPSSHAPQAHTKQTAIMMNAMVRRPRRAPLRTYLGARMSACMHVCCQQSALGFPQLIAYAFL